MATLTVAAGSTKFALLAQWAVRQGTSHVTALGAGVQDSDYARRTRELINAGLVEYTGKTLGNAKVIRITPEGRAVCRTLKAQSR